jgi:hypothetical protein
MYRIWIMFGRKRLRTKRTPVIFGDLTSARGLHWDHFVIGPMP